MKNKQAFENIKKASKSILLLNAEIINAVLNNVANAIVEQAPYILAENKKDLARMNEDDPKYDRLLLTTERIKSIAHDIRNVASLPSPLGKTLMSKTQPNGLQITKETVPFGVIGIIYESRPNVTVDVFALCLKSGNACMLKGGSDAHDSNMAITKIIKEVLKKHQLNEDIITLLPAEREAAADLLNAHGYVDLIIPRGSQGLINFVRENASIPVIETGAGIVHTYFDEFADLKKGTKIIVNAKTRRVSVCNALDCLVIHKKRLAELPQIIKEMESSNVLIYADKFAFKALQGNYPTELLQKANTSSFGTEFLSHKMSIKTVENIDEAIDHINQYSSMHSEAIISENRENINKFLKLIDASSVYANVSTAFTDGAQFGLGAEIGISTQKLHARGPMALEELTSYKWIIQGDGVIRDK